MTVYGYSPSGLRVSQVTNGVTKTWSYQGTAIASEHSSDASDVHQVYTVLGGVALERHDIDTVVDETNSRYYAYNHRGDVVAVTDDTGALLYAYDYGAYGDITQTYNSQGGAAPADDIHLTGKNLDPVTGLYYFNARWYDPTTGMFISATPLPPYREEPYAFCGNNPISRIDLSGLQYGWIYPIHYPGQSEEKIPEPTWEGWVPFLGAWHAMYYHAQQGEALWSALNAGSFIFDLGGVGFTIRTEAMPILSKIPWFGQGLEEGVESFGTKCIKELGDKALGGIDDKLGMDSFEYGLHLLDEGNILTALAPSSWGGLTGGVVGGAIKYGPTDFARAGMVTIASYGIRSADGYTHNPRDSDWLLYD